MRGNHNLSWPWGPVYRSCVQVLDGRQFSANQLLSRANDTLPPALGSGSSVTGDDEGGGNGLGVVEVHPLLLLLIVIFIY